ncbi:MAG: cell division protein SepF [Christensenellaceae bacterium]|jgi:cell division inhibitor SepF
MAKIGQKILSFIGLEETDPEMEQDFYEEDEIEEGMMDFPEDDYVPPAPDKKYKKRGDTGKVTGVPDTSKVRVLIYKPVSYEDTQSIIDNLKERKPIIVNLDELDTDVAQRILDFISGAVYALNGNIRKAARNIFVVAPYNVDVSTNTAEVMEEYGFNYFNRE